MDEERKVIKFNPERSFTHKRPGSGKAYCNHSGVLVNEENRSIECQECGIILDPFDFLKKTCYQDESAFTKFVTLENEVAKLEKRYKNLNTEIDRLNRVKKALKS